MIGQADASIHHYVENINSERIKHLTPSDNRELQLELLVFLLRSRSCNLLRESSQQKQMWKVVEYFINEGIKVRNDSHIRPFFRKQKNTKVTATWNLYCVLSAGVSVELIDLPVFVRKEQVPDSSLCY